MQHEGLIGKPQAVLMQVRLDEKAFAAGDQQTADRGLVGKGRVTRAVNDKSLGAQSKMGTLQKGVVSGMNNTINGNNHQGKEKATPLVIDAIQRCT